MACNGDFHSLSAKAVGGGKKERKKRKDFESRQPARSWEAFQQRVVESGLPLGNVRVRVGGI